MLAEKQEWNTVKLKGVFFFYVYPALKEKVLASLAVVFKMAFCI